MTPTIALFFCLFVSSVIIKYELKISNKANYSRALIIPLIWFLVVISRNPSGWLFTNQQVALSTDAVMEGNPLNRTFFSILTIIGIIILLKRNINWSVVYTKNKWVYILFVYYMLSSTWSDFPLITLKRIIRDIGNPVMLFILLTDKDPVSSVKYLLKWTTYTFIPLSIIYYKYFPSIGRVYHPFSGELAITGVANNKNNLGVLCLICGFYLIWELQNLIKNKRRGKEFKPKFLILLTYLLMVLWILIEAKSATSLMSFLIAVALLFSIELPMVKNNIKNLGLIAVMLLIVFGILQMSFGVFQMTVEALGRDPTLTGRTVLWEECLKMKINPIVGTGYNCFWIGPRYDYFLNRFWWHPNQAHSGYVGTFLEQGIIGIILLSFFIISTFNKIRNELSFNFDYGKFRFAFFVVSLIYNITEESFKSLQPIWFILLLVHIVDSDVYGQTTCHNQIKCD